MTVHQMSDGDQRLAAYYVGLKSVTVAELRETLQQSLPAYMIPQHFMALDEIPLTPNGKVDRKALPDPDADAEALTEYVAPRNAIEEQLATLWQEVLGTDNIGIHDNFFERGGHSLLAARVARCRYCIGS